MEGPKKELSEPKPEVEGTPVEKDLSDPNPEEEEEEEEKVVIEDIDIDGIIYSLLKEDGLIVDKQTSEHIGVLKSDGSVNFFKDLDDIVEQQNIKSTLYNVFYSKEVNVGDVFLIIYNVDDEIQDSIIEIESINIEEKIINIKGDDKLLLQTLEISEDIDILLKTENYEILDIEKIEEIEEKILEDLELKLTKDLIQEIVFEDIITSDKFFSDNERKEELLSELISIFKSYNNEKITKEITDICENYIPLIREKINNNLRNKDCLSFIKDLLNDKITGFPDYIKPIVSAKRNLYVEDPAPDPETGQNVPIPEDVIQADLNDELSYNNDPESERMEYKDYLNVILNDRFQNYHINDKHKKFITDYNGEYLRDCLFEETCTSAGVSQTKPGIDSADSFIAVLKKLYSYDNIKTRNTLEIPILRNDQTDFEIMKNKEKVNIVGFLLYPSRYLDHKFNLHLQQKLFSLTEIANYYSLTYSYKIFKERFNNDNIISKTIDIDKQNLEGFTDELSLYLLHDNVIDSDKTTIGAILKENLPKKRDLISIPNDKLMSLIFSINSFEKLFNNYDIRFEDLDNSLKKDVTERINNNIKEYLKSYEKVATPLPQTEFKIRKKTLTQEERSKLSLSYILGLLNEKQKYSYLRRYIDLFLRNAKKDQNKNYFYNRYTGEQSLCKHYLHLINSENDPTAFDKMLNTWRMDEIKDGYVCCRCCGEYLCPEGFSPLQGFSDGKPTNTNEKMEQEEENLFKELTEEQKAIKELIIKFQKLFNISLNQLDIKNILEIFETIENKDLVNRRYSEFTDVFTEHPRYRSMTKALVVKEGMKEKEKKKMLKKIKDANIEFQKYLLSSNKILCAFYLIILFTQTAIPSYGHKIKYKILDLDKDFTLIREIINQQMLTYIEKLFIDETVKNPGNENTKTISYLLKESTDYALKNIYNHFTITIEYLQENFFIKTRITKYRDYLISGENSVYLKESWGSYKPLPGSDLTLQINRKVNSDHELTDLDKHYENNSLLNEIRNVRNTEKYKELGITISEFMNDQSYKRLLKYSLQLYGKHTKNITQIDLLINRIIDQLENTSIIGIFKSLGWDNKTLKNFNYNDLREKILIDIPNLYRGEDSKATEALIHITSNNFDIRLLSCYQSLERIYHYDPVNIYPIYEYDELKTRKSYLIDKIFSLYCYDENGIIVKRKNDNYLNRLLMDYDETREPQDNCEGTGIAKTKDNFYKYLEYVINNNKLEFLDNLKLKIDFYDKEILEQIRKENIVKYRPFQKLYEFILKNNKYTEFEADVSYDKFIMIREMIDKLNDETMKDKLQTDFDDIISSLIDNKETYLADIKENLKVFLKECKDTNKIKRLERYYNMKMSGQIKGNQKITSVLYNTISTKMVQSLEQILDKCDTFKKINFIKNIYYIISRIKNNNFDNGCYFNTEIPKIWKINVTNKDKLSDFMKNHEFLIHDEVFSTKPMSNSFYDYKSNYQYFVGLYDYIDHYQKDIESLIGLDNSDYILNKSNYNYLIDFLFINILHKFVEYITNLKEEDSEEATNAIEIFKELKKEEIATILGTIDYCSTLFIDLLQDMIESFYDPTYLYENENLDLFSKQISKQKEREKQFLVSDLTSQTNEQRLLTTESQKHGLSNWFDNLSKRNEEYRSSDQYKQDTEEERLRRISENTELNDSEKDIFEREGLDLDSLLRSQLQTEVTPQDLGYGNGTDATDQNSDDENDDEDNIDGYDS